MVNRLMDAYRWRRTLRSCALDPHQLPRPVAQPGDSDFILAGCPRTGTSLLAAVLFRPPAIVTVMEPWDGLRLAPAVLFRSLRHEIESEGRLSRGRLDLDALMGGRVVWQRDGERSYRVDVGPEFQLGVKWPTFWQYLDLLPDTRFVLTVRHPLEVISSFERVGGRLARGLDYDVAFNERLNDALTAETRDPAVRRALLYEHVNRAMLGHFERDNVLVVRYERWFDDQDGLLADLSAFLGVDLEGPNVEIRDRSDRRYEDDLRRLIRHHAPVYAELGYEV